MVPTDDDESVGRSTYENLVRLTFLCGRGLEPAELARRYLAAMRPNIPATGAWLFQGGKIIAADAGRGQRIPAAPGPMPPGLAPQIDPDGLVAAPVLPEMVLVCRLSSGSVQRASDVICLVARIIALAWQAEMVACNEPWDDDYLTSKAMFKRRWFRWLLRRHGNNVSAAARAAGIPRGTFYAMMDQVGVRNPEAADDDPLANADASAPASPTASAPVTAAVTRTRRTS